MSEDEQNNTITIDLNINLNHTETNQENEYLKKTIQNTLETIKHERNQHQQKMKDIIEENEELRIEINKLRQNQRVKK